MPKVVPRAAADFVRQLKSEKVLSLETYQRGNEIDARNIINVINNYI